jgi:hypothetical protein
MFETIVSRSKALLAKAALWWSSLNVDQQVNAAGAGAAFAIGVFTGGIIGTSMLMGFFFSAGAFRLIVESKKVKAFIGRQGYKVDMAFTLLTFFFSPLPGVTGAFAACFAGLFFSLFRGIFCPVEVVSEVSSSGQDQAEGLR